MQTLTFILIFLSLLLLSCEPKDSVKAEQANSLGMTYISQGKEKEAIIAFRRAASYKAVADTNRIVYLRNLSLTYEEIDLMDSAKYYFRQAEGMTPPGSYYNLVNRASICLIDNKIDSALILLSAAHKTSDNNFSVNNYLGLIYLGQYDSSYFDPQKALQYNLAANNTGTDNSTKFALARNYYYLNKMHEALHLFREIHTLYPKDIDYLITLIMVEQEMGNRVKADILLDKLKLMDIDKYNERINDPISPGSHIIAWN